MASSTTSPREHADIEPSDKRPERHVAAAGSSDEFTDETGDA